MDQKYKISLVIGLLAVVLLAGIAAFFIAGGSSTSGGSDGNSTMWIIMISQIPIWVSLSVATRESRKKKEAEKAKNDYQAQDADYFADKLLSDEGEIVSYEEIENARRLKQNRKF